MCPGEAKAASEANRSVSHFVSACARRHGEIQYRLLSSVEGAQFLFTALCVRKACLSRVTQASLPQLGPLQAFQPMLVAPSPGKAADPVHQFYIKAAGRACCWAEK